MARRRSRVKRSEHDLVESLINHVSLLREYYVKAYQQGDDRYLGEVAGKLRLLVLRGKRNKPLLLEMMARYDYREQIKLNEPLEKKPLTVDEFLDRLAFFVRSKDGPVTFTHREFVQTWSQQHGAAHEDLSHDRRLAASRNLPVMIQGEHSHKWHLGAVARTMLSVADSFFLHLEKRGVIRRADS